MNERMVEPRNFSNFDHWLSSVDRGLKAILHLVESNRRNPAQAVPDLVLNEPDRKKSAALIRVNHAGEVCAQALYQGQALTVRNQKTRAMLLEATAEEMDHLIWCQARLDELNSRTSYLNFCWYGGSFLMGAVVGFFPDSVNLGFVAETERQVSMHLESHLQKIAAKDLRSRAILSQMYTDEQRHGARAFEGGGKALPIPLRWVMKAMSKVMTTTAFWV